MAYPIRCIGCNKNDPLMKVLCHLQHYHPWYRYSKYLSYNFTKKRSSKIFKIEKINRQTNYKNGLILTNKTSIEAKTLSLRSWKHVLEVLFTCFNGIKACKFHAYLNALVVQK